MLVHDDTTTIGQMVRECPNRARVFEAFKIDYCCGGKFSLKEACQKRGLDVQEVWRKLDEADARRQDDSQWVDADSMSLAELCNHIEQTHHAYLRAELPRLDYMTDKVAKVHGGEDPRLLQVRQAFEAFRAEVEPHMMKEEVILFPLIRQMETHRDSAPGQPLPPFHCGTIRNPIRQMLLEHDHAGDALQAMSKLTNEYAAPEWACNTYRAMLDSLRQLERNMHQHVHKENNVLFIKAAELEDSLQA